MVKVGVTVKVRDKLCLGFLVRVHRVSGRVRLSVLVILRVYVRVRVLPSPLWWAIRFCVGMK